MNHTQRLRTLFAGALLVLWTSALSAQQELMLNTMRDVWHSNTTNPAFFPDNRKLVIGLPAYGMDAVHSGNASFNDIFRKENDRNVVDFGQVIQKLDADNTLRFDQRIETFSIGFKLLGFAFSAGHANRLSGQLSYPKALPELIWYGNAAYVGQTLQIAPRADIFDWNEWSIGVSRQLGPLSLGARIKYLNGVSAFKTDPDHRSAAITTSADIYQISMDIDYGFHSSSIISAIDTAGLGFDVQFADLEGALFSSNRGFAYDLGVVYRVNSKLSVSASLLDIGGSIKWSKNGQYFLSQGVYTYDGVSIPGEDIINGTDSLDFDAKLDTLNDIFNFNKTAANFTTRLPQRTYVQVAFDLTRRWSFGCSFFAQKTEMKTNTAFGLSARWKPLKWLSLGAMYSVNDQSAANLGFHFATTARPLQFYFSSDNLLNAFSLKNKPAVNLRAGAALVF